MAPMSNAISDNVRSRIIGVYGLLAAANIGAWIWAMLAFRDTPILLGTAFLAYTFGLRHAVDADHIAAIDNVTRKLMQDGTRPVSVGFYFAFGHSIIVFIAAFIAYWTAATAEKHFEYLNDIGGIVGTCVSVSFLFGIALINILILRGVYRAFRQVSTGGSYPEQTADMFMGGGFLARLLGPLFKLLSQPWHMLPIGFLFGLGFETATEVALLGISASAGAKGVSLQDVMVLPALFTAGMTLVDTTDGVLMLGAYGWAFLKPIRKLYYNLTITFISVLVALIVGGVEAVGLVKDQFNLSGGVWDFIGMLNDNFGTLGFVIIGVFAVSWIGSMIFYRVKGYEELASSGGIAD
jgi:nickel/cobalt transporter (NiCoT) family protein